MSDTLREKIAEFSLVDNNQLQSWINRLSSSAITSSPVTLLQALFNNIDSWTEKASLSLLSDYISIAQNLSPQNIHYIPAPGYQDAQPLVQFEEYEKLVPLQQQRQMAFLSSKNSNLILILDLDPWMAEQISDDATFTFWKDIAAQSGYSPKNFRRGLTGLHEALNHQSKERWSRKPVTNSARLILQKYNLDPIWETPTHIFTWADTTATSFSPKSLDDLQHQLYKITVSIKPVYMNLLGEKSKNTHAQNHQGTLSDSERIVQQIWEKIRNDAILSKASDIHIHPNHDGGLVIAIRQHGLIRMKAIIPPSRRDLMYRVIMLGTGVDPLRDPFVPKDARSSISNVPGMDRSIDLRYSLLPGKAPESWPKIVIRILDPLMVRNNIFGLITDKQDIKIWEYILNIKNGITIVTGPTGSGKSVTLYAMLQSIHHSDSNIVINTIEDPIEYRVASWLHQSQVESDRGVHFSHLLRQCLRQDIDMLMLGEIRDKETATLANQFASSGHALLSTLHVTSSARIPERLKELGVDPNPLSSTFQAGIAQRLVGLSCPNCQSYPTQSLLRKAVLADCPLKFSENLIENKGCEQCDHLGIIGRTAVQEFTLIEHASERKLIRQMNLSKLKQQMHAKGLKPIVQKVWELANEQKISVSEALKIAQHRSLQTHISNIPTQRIRRR